MLKRTDALHEPREDARVSLARGHGVAEDELLFQAAAGEKGRMVYGFVAGTGLGRRTGRVSILRCRAPPRAMAGRKGSKTPTRQLIRG